MNPHQEPAFRLPPVYSRSVELCQQRALNRWIERDAPGRALDVACGNGAWCVELASHGWDVTGLASDSHALRVARRRADENCARCRFQIGDATSPEIDGEFDLVLSVGVLQRIPDHDRCAEILARLSRVLTARGRLVLLEAAPTRRDSRCDTRGFRARTFDWYRRTLEDAGLGIVEVLGVDPIPLKTWLLPYYRQLPRMVRDIALGATSALSFPLDWLLGPSLPSTSWHKLIVAGRTSRR